MIYLFADYELDTTLYELRAAGVPCKLEPRVFNVLAYLVQHRAQVVTREELLNTLWPGLMISETLLNNCIMEARKAVGDSGQLQHVIKTLHGRGYRFIATTTEWLADDQPRATPGRAAVARVMTPPSRGHVAPGMPTLDTPSEAFQDVLAGDQTVGTVMCGTLDRGEGHMAGGGCAGDAAAAADVFCPGAGGSAASCRDLHLFWRGWSRATVHAGDACAASCVCGPPTPTARAGVCDRPRHPDPRRPLRCAAVCIPVPWLYPPCPRFPGVRPWLRGDHNRGRRLHYLAPPGTLLSSQATLQFLHETVRWVDHGLVRLPGQVEPIMAYCLGEPGASASRTAV